MAGIQVQYVGGLAAAAAALVAAAAIAVWALRARRRWPDAVAWLLRGVVVALALAAVAQPSWVHRGAPPTLYVLIDRSASMPAQSWTQALLAELKPRLGNARIVAFAFAGGAQATDLDAAAALADAPPADGSDPNPAFAMTAVAAAGRDAHVLLLSDGDWTAPATIPPAWKVWALCPPTGRANAGLVELAAAQSGDALAVRAAVRSNHGGQAVVRLFVRDSTDAPDSWRSIAQQATMLLADQVRSFTWSRPVAGTDPGRQVRVQVTADWDELDGDNALTSLVAAPADERRCLLLTADPNGPVARALAAAAAWQPIVRTPQQADEQRLLDAVDPPRVVVLDDVSADKLGASLTDALGRHVRNGGGLLVLGGPNVRGLGGAADWPLEPLLPVRSRPRDRAPAAIVLLLDRSGSMSESPALPSGGDAPAAASKLDLLKQAVLGLADLFEPTDRLAVIGFNDQAQTVYAAPADGPVDWRAVRQGLLKLQPSGGTAIGPAVRAAADWLAGQHAPRKHLLLLTDGQFDDQTVEQASETLAKGNDTLTVSTFATNPQADSTFLADLARRFGGAHYPPGDWGRLARRFRDDLAGALAPTEATGPLTVQAEGDRPALPPVRRVLTSELRDGAGLWYVAQAGANEKAWPLVAVAPIGAGRSAVVATSPSAGWADAWAGSAAVGELLARLLDDVGGTGNDARFILHATADDDDRLELTVTVRDDESGEPGPVDLLDLSARLIDTAGGEQVVPLEQVAPGEYAAAASVAGPRRVMIVQRDDAGERVVLRRVLGPPLAAEFGHLTPQPARLDALCRAHGGRLVESLEELDELDLAPGQRRTDLWPWLLLAAVAAWACEVIVSRPGGRDA